jgi:hypothetical protein
MGFRKLKLFLRASIDDYRMETSFFYFVPIIIPARNCWQARGYIVTAASWNCSQILPIVIIEAFLTFKSLWVVFSARTSTRSNHSCLGI